MSGILTGAEAKGWINYPNSCIGNLFIPLQKIMLPKDVPAGIIRL